MADRIISMLKVRVVALRPDQCAVKTQRDLRCSAVKFLAAPLAIEIYWRAYVTHIIAVLTQWYGKCVYKDIFLRFFLDVSASRKCLPQSVNASQHTMGTRMGNRFVCCCFSFFWWKIIYLCGFFPVEQHKRMQAEFLKATVAYFQPLRQIVNKWLP